VTADYVTLASYHARSFAAGLIGDHGGFVAAAKKKDDNKNKNNNKNKNKNKNNKGGGGGGGKKKDDNKNKNKNNNNKNPTDAVFNDAFFSNVIEGTAGTGGGTASPLPPDTPIETISAPVIDPSKPLSLEDKMKLASACLSAKELPPITNPKEMKEAVPLWNNLNTTLPLGVVQPSTTQEVSDAISCLYSNGVRAVPYSGGCSLMGMSVLPTSVTVDLSLFMNGVTLNQDSSLTVQGGATLGDIYSSTFEQSKGIYSVVGASCPALGVGQMLGGGIGSLTRMFGLACDQLLGLTMVQYDGQILKVTPTDNPDLFWASCGGGGGNFGVVSEYVIKTVNVPPTLTSFDFSVTNNVVAFMMDVQDKIAVDADPLFSKLQMTFQNTTTKGKKGQKDDVKWSVDVRGLYLGPEAGLAAALKDSGLAAYVEKRSARSRTVNWVDFVIEQARSSNCTKANDAAGLADRKLTNFGQDVSMNSFYVLPSNTMSASGWEDLFKWKASGKDAFVEVDVLGPKSKVAAVATPDTAYAFRPALLAVQFGTAWRSGKKNDRMNLALSSAGTVGNELDRRALAHLVIAP